MEDSDHILSSAVAQVLRHAKEEPSLLSGTEPLVLTDEDGELKEPVDPAWMCAEYRARMDELEAEGKLARLLAVVACLNKDLRSFADGLWPAAARKAAADQVLAARTFTTSAFRRGVMWGDLKFIQECDEGDGAAAPPPPFVLSPVHLEQLDKKLGVPPPLGR